MKSSSLDIWNVSVQRWSARARKHKFILPVLYAFSLLGYPGVWGMSMAEEIWMRWYASLLFWFLIDVYGITFAHAAF